MRVFDTLPMPNPRLSRTLVRQEIGVEEQRSYPLRRCEIGVEDRSDIAGSHISGLGNLHEMADPGGTEEARGGDRLAPLIAADQPIDDRPRHHRPRESTRDDQK